MVFARVAAPGVIVRLRGWFPAGRTLPEAAWAARHRGLLMLLALHAPALAVFALWRGFDPLHAALEGGAVALFAVAASWPGWPRRARSVLASLGLITASAALVHISGGYIEAHFHFFVMLGVISLYEDWTPFLVAVAYVTLHHGIVGTLDPASVYNHAAAFANPWQWAMIHAAFVLGLSAANVVTWRLSERTRNETRQILESTGEAMIGVGADGKVTFANPAAARLTGLSVEELVARPIADVLAGVERMPAAATGRFAFEGRLRRRDGEEVVVEGSATPLGEPRHGEVIAMRDVTELRRSQRNLENFVETSAIGLRWVDAQGVIIWANRADAELLGYSVDDYIGRNIRELHVDPAVFEEKMRRLLAGEAVVELEARLRAKDGSIRRVLIDSNALFEGDRFVHTRSFTRDITDRRKAEEDLAEARRQVALTEKLSALGSLVSGVAHEIRTPLTYTANHLYVIDSRLRKLGRQRATDSEAVAQLEGSIREALEGVDRINHLVEDLRRFTRLPSDQRVEDSLSRPVREAVDLYEATHRGSVSLDAQLEHTPPVLLDKLQIQQVVINLLDNATDASPPGATVAIRTAHTADGAELTVSDAGVGMSDDVRARIFDPFFTTKPHGTGLGLSIVQRIVAAHQGRVEIESEPGKGTRIRVILPVEPHEPYAASPGRIVATSG